MKKPMIKIKDFANLQNIKKRITNAFSEKGAEAAEALRALIDELESSEVEFDEVAFADAVKELIANYEEVPEVIAEAIADKVKTIQNTLGADNKVQLSHKIKNEISAAILKAKGKADVESAVQRVLIKNDITSYDFANVVDFVVSEGWEKHNPLFLQLHKTFYTRFFYSSDDTFDVSVAAKGWDSTQMANYEKIIQDLQVSGKSIVTDYVYKKQRIAFRDLDEIENSGETTTFLQFLNDELDNQIANGIMGTILISDLWNNPGEKISTFESIGDKVATDAFTSVVNPLTPGTVTIEDMRALSDSVINPNGKKKVMILSQTLLSTLSAFQYGAGGTTHYRSKEEMAGQFGVDEIFTTDVLDLGTNTYAVCMLPDGYWYNEKKTLSVTYPNYEKNAMMYLKERNIGGAIHDILSTAVLKD